jgi:hypothetical protein
MRANALAVAATILFVGCASYTPRLDPEADFIQRAVVQDLGLQKARDTVDERNHLRLWVTPVTFQGSSVWIGQISRDIGVRLTSKTITTHKIDPDVDDARFYLIQDLINSGALARFGYVKGVGVARRDEPRHNFTGDPYYTDGLRAVFFLSPHYIEYDEIDWVKEWERPPDPAELGRRSAGE